MSPTKADLPSGPATRLRPAVDPSSDTEAFATLVALAARRTGAIPAEWLVRHLMATYTGAGWPVQRAAWEAVHRRLEFARRDRLAVASRPPSPLGLYATRRARSTERPYRTLLRSLEPYAGSCDCPDFARGSLGLCKHLLVVLDDLAARPRRWRSALAAPCLQPALTWYPIRPLTGSGDWLEGIRAADGGIAGRPLLAWLERDETGAWVPRQTYPDQPAQRLRFVTALAREASRARRASGRAGNGAGVDPALATLLASEKQRLERYLAQRTAAPHTRRALAALKRKLYPYQRTGVERFLATGRLLLADDMGLGKTAQGIAACQALFTTGRVRRGLLIVPASLKEQWRREWQLWSDVPVAVVDGPRASRRQIYATCRKGFLITNYEQVLRDLEDIRAWQPGMIVLDEAQRIKNWATKTAACVKTLRPEYRLVLTGTPMENRLEELASIMDWVDDLALEPKWRLAPWHAELADGRREVVGAQHLDTLRQRLAPSFLRRVRREVLAQLPPRTDTVVPVELTAAQAEEHAALDQPIRQLLARAGSRPLTQAEFLRLMTLLTTQRIIANGMAQLDFERVWPALSTVRQPDPSLLAGLSTPKLLALRDLVAQIVVGQQRKAVVFSQWRRMLLLAQWAVADLLAGAELRAVFFTGHESPRRRNQNIVELHDDPRTAILFATDAGGVGLNLQRAASCCVNLDLPWNPAVLEQRIGRIYRLGQRAPIDVYDLVTQASIEERIAALVASKQAFFSNLFDGDSNEVRFEHSGSFLSRLERLIEPSPAPRGEEAESEPGAEMDNLDEIEATLESAHATLGDELPSAVTETGEAADRPATSRAPTAGAADALARPEELRNLLAQLHVHPTAAGGLVIEAPPEAAGTLATLFEGLARALRAGAGAGGGVDH